MQTYDTSGGIKRRGVLIGIGAGAVALAGCLAGSSSGAENVPVLGNPDADVTLEVYEDLGCPACAEYNQSPDGFPAIEDGYIEPNHIRYEHRDLITTPNGAEAANAAREVYHRHGNEAFWEYKSAVLADQGSLQNAPFETLREIADDQGLDADAIREAAGDRAHADEISDDESRAGSLGANQTPSFVVDDNLVGGGVAAVQQTRQELDEALQ